MQSLISYYAALLSLVEISLGSFLHGFRIPFSGHALSLNQGLILTQALQKTESRKDAVTAANGISIITAILKSLSPMGKRLTPMLAISIQGFLFSLGVFVLGNNLFGILIGMTLLSLWGFAQPLLFAYLFFGEKLFLAIEKLWTDIAGKLSIDPVFGLWILVSFVLFKVTLSWVIGFMGWKYPRYIAENYLQKILKYKNLIPVKKNRALMSPGLGALKDLLSPWIIVSLVLTIAFMWLTEKSEFFKIFIYGLRVVAIAYLVFWILRAFPRAWIEKALTHYPTLKTTVDRLLDHELESTEPKR